MKKLFDLLKKIFKGLDIGLREVSTSLIEKELEETENVFALLTMGAFAGIPSPPTGIILRILPYMQREIYVMIARSKNIDDALAEIVGIFSIE
ncbi:MAG TPA: hypothetical protein P5272_03820 [Caldisericia bacterium]|nr:hypothetical protein [Caldisericia bacterium]HPC56349.1 hypothetical protein [Caldisericia bacterium]HRT36997.1 hypothetical protein [Caldisericia bacterium]HRU74096.1 hypothetical protein [Caldisericia bacterium]